MTDFKNSDPQFVCHGDERERLAQMFEQAPSLMALLREPNHRIVLANRAFQSLFGTSETIGRTVDEVLPEQMSAAAITRLDEAYRTGKAVRLEAARFRSRPHDAGAPTERILDLILQPIRDANGAVIGVFVEGSDVTDRFLAERRLQSSFEIQTVGSR